jgi:hypothetical protein
MLLEHSFSELSAKRAVIYLFPTRCNLEWCTSLQILVEAFLPITICRRKAPEHVVHAVETRWRYGYVPWAFLHFFFICTVDELQCSTRLSISHEMKGCDGNDMFGFDQNREFVYVFILDPFPSTYTNNVHANRRQRRRCLISSTHNGYGVRILSRAHTPRSYTSIVL